MHRGSPTGRGRLRVRLSLETEDSCRSPNQVPGTDRCLILVQFPSPALCNPRGGSSMVERSGLMNEAWIKRRKSACAVRHNLPASKVVFARGSFFSEALRAQAMPGEVRRCRCPSLARKRTRYRRDFRPASSFSPASVTCVERRFSERSDCSPARCLRPASVTFV